MKKQETQHAYVRLPIRTKRELKKMARREAVTMAQIIRRAIDAMLKETR